MAIGSELRSAATRLLRVKCCKGIRTVRLCACIRPWSNSFTQLVYGCAQRRGGATAKRVQSSLRDRAFVLLRFTRRRQWGALDAKELCSKSAKLHGHMSSMLGSGSWSGVLEEVQRNEVVCVVLNVVHHCFVSLPDSTNFEEVQVTDPERRHELEVDFSYNHRPKKVFADLHLNIDLVDILAYDWQHVYVVQGIHTKELTAVWSDLDEHNMEDAALHEFLQLWIWPKSTTSATLLCKMRDGLHGHRGTASEFLSSARLRSARRCMRFFLLSSCFRKPRLVTSSQED